MPVTIVEVTLRRWIVVADLQPATIQQEIQARVVAHRTQGMKHCNFRLLHMVLISMQVFVPTFLHL